MIPVREFGRQTNLVRTTCVSGWSLRDSREGEQRGGGAAGEEEQRGGGAAGRMRAGEEGHPLTQVVLTGMGFATCRGESLGSFY